MFLDRTDAANQLSELLKKYQELDNGVVIGLPRGGVVLAAVVARKLHLPLDVICPRKIGLPGNKEFAIGAITEKGELIADRDLIETYGVSGVYLEREIGIEMAQAQRRLALFRQGLPPRNLKDRVVIIVDDGLATGMTMKAAVRMAQEEGAAKVVVAVPVAPPETIAVFEEMVDEVVCLLAPYDFHAVGQFYRDFAQVEDEEVVKLLQASSNH